MNNLQVRQQETRLAETNEAKVLLPILQEYVTLYRGDIQNEPVKKKNILILANELAKVKINNRPAIESATPSSIREVALRVITEDIDLSKKQANLIPYGNDITLQKQFYGNVALAKQSYGNHIEFYSQLVYPNDSFEIIKNGLGFGRDEYKHTTSPKNMVNIKDNYKTVATPVFVYTYVVDTETNNVIATNCFSYERCYNSWTQSGIKPTHKKFPGEMMIKTSESYLATRLYNKSNSDNDNQLEDEYEQANDNETIVVEDFEPQEIKEDAPKKTVKRATKPKPQVVEEPIVVEEINETPYEIFDFDTTIEPQYEEPQVEVEQDKGYEFTEMPSEDYEINSFLDDDIPNQPQEPKGKTILKGVKYRDYIEKYKAQGYKAINNSYDQVNKTIDIELE